MPSGKVAPPVQTGPPVAVRKQLYVYRRRDLLLRTTTSRVLSLLIRLIFAAPLGALSGGDQERPTSRTVSELEKFPVNRKEYMAIRELEGRLESVSSAKSAMNRPRSLLSFFRDNGLRDTSPAAR